jgi:hypothetical protein
MAKANLSQDEVKGLVAQLPDADVYAALCCLAMKRGQNGDQRNVDGMFRGMTELMTMLACPMSIAHRMQIGGILKDAADTIIDCRDRSIGNVAEQMH